MAPRIPWHPMICFFVSPSCVQSGGNEWNRKTNCTFRWLSISWQSAELIPSKSTTSMYPRLSFHVCLGLETASSGQSRHKSLPLPLENENKQHLFPKAKSLGSISFGVRGCPFGSSSLYCKRAAGLATPNILGLASPTMVAIFWLCLLSKLPKSLETLEGWGHLLDRLLLLLTHPK